MQLNGHSYSLDTLARDVATLIEQVGRAPSPATGEPGSGLLRAVAELIAREDERDARRDEAAKRAEQRAAWGQWAVVIAIVVSAATAVTVALR